VTVKGRLKSLKPQPEVELIGKIKVVAAIRYKDPELAALDWRAAFGPGSPPSSLMSVAARG
jgi:hypothetical protein